MLKKILIGLGAIIGIFVIVVVVQPANYVVERSIDIKAPAEVVYTEVSDFKRWDAWSPWAKLDPNIKKTFAGEAGAIDSSYSWEGNSEVGKGKMTVIKAEAPTSISQRLEFIEPMKSMATTTHTIKPAAEGVTVTWSMEGDNGFMAKMFGLFMDIETMIGADYEKGLASLKLVAENKAKEAPMAAGPTPDAEAADTAVK